MNEICVKHEQPVAEGVKETSQLLKGNSGARNLSGEDRFGFDKNECRLSLPKEINSSVQYLRFVTLDVSIFINRSPGVQTLLSPGVQGCRVYLHCV